LTAYVTVLAPATIALAQERRHI